MRKLHEFEFQCIIIIIIVCNRQKYGEVGGRWRDIKNADKILVNELGTEEIP